MYCTVHNGPHHSSSCNGPVQSAASLFHGSMATLQLFHDNLDPILISCRSSRRRRCTVLDIPSRATVLHPPLAVGTAPLGPQIPRLRWREWYFTPGHELGQALWEARTRVNRSANPGYLLGSFIPCFTRRPGRRFRADVVECWEDNNDWSVLRTAPGPSFRSGRWA